MTKTIPLSGREHTMTSNVGRWCAAVHQLH